MRSVWIALLVLSVFPVARAESPSYESDTKVVPLTRHGADLAGDDVLPVVRLDTFVYQVRAAEKELDEPVYDCEATETDGTAGDWKGFWTAPDAFKAVHLAQAIQGLDHHTAVRLIQDGTFTTRPRSWAELASRIEAASARYQNAFAYHVLVEHKQENIRNLGYLTEGCRHHWEKTVEPVHERLNAEPRSLRAQVRIHGGALLPVEQETYTVTFDGFHHALHCQSDYNSYRVVESATADGLIQWDLFATRKVEAPANTLDLRLANMANGFAILVTDRNFDREADATGSRRIVATVVHRRKAWDPRSEVVLAQFERTLDDNYRDTAINDLGLTLPSGKIQVRYTIRYENSRYYSTEESTWKTVELKN